MARVPSSPLKRNRNDNQQNEAESPSKRVRMPATSQLRANIKALDLIRNGGDSSPKRNRSASLCQDAPKKSFARLVSPNNCTSLVCNLAFRKHSIERLVQSFSKLDTL